MASGLMGESFDVIEDSRGSLLPISLDKLAITPRRIFVVTGAAPGVIRGGHGPGSGCQLLVLLSGAVAVIVRRASEMDEVVELGKPGDSLWLYAGDVAWQRYADAQSSLLVIADTAYRENDYTFVSDALCDEYRQRLESL